MSALHNWKPYLVYSDMELFSEASEQVNKENVVFQTGLTGSTGYILSFHPCSSCYHGG